MDFELPAYPTEVEVFPASKIEFSSDKCYKYSTQPEKNQDKYFSLMNNFKYLGKYYSTDSLDSKNPVLNFEYESVKKTHNPYFRETICHSNGGRKSRKSRKPRKPRKSKRKFLKY